MPLYTSTDLEAVANALGEDATIGQVFKADGSGSGTMTKNTQTIANSITVGKSGDVDFNSIASAITYAVAEGAAAGNNWQILTYPGTYLEPPMSVITGVHVVQAVQNRTDSVYVVAINANSDLFTMNGGSVTGITAMGVTHVDKACFRVSNPLAITFLQGCSVLACSNGILIDSAATCIVKDIAALVLGPSQDIGNVIKVSGAGSFLGVVGGLFSVPAALLPYYASNPVQNGIYCTGGASANITSCSFNLAYKDTTANAVLVDDGAIFEVSSSGFAGNANAIHVGATGSNSVAALISTTFSNNELNIKIASSTGIVYTNMMVDKSARSVVSGGKITGLIQYKDSAKTLLEGNVDYSFETGKSIELSEFINATTSTGLLNGGVVSAGTGLHVDVTAGEGIISRGSPNFDSWNVSWEAVEDLDLTASTTNYIVYCSTDDTIEVSLSAPGDVGILLATAVTDSSGIRYLHQTRSVVYGFKKAFEAYLGATFKRALSSGLAVSEGSSARKFDIASGAYYINMDLVSYAGDTDATFSSFYGTNGATEISGQTELNITQYDSAGTLTSLTTDYFRSDTVILTSDGRVNVIFGTEQYDAEGEATAALLGNTPTFMEASYFTLARLIVKQGVGIVAVVDARIQPASGGSGGTGGVSSHSALNDLDKPADHTWAMLVDGTRAMSGSLNMNSNTITNAGTINSVSITAHNARHQPGGSDAIATAAPTGILVAATAAEGTATSLARSDHQHGIASGVPSTIGAANAQGSSTSVARLDHVHGHGDQAGGSVHAVATTSVAGFQSAADKTKLDGIEANATATPLSSTAPVNVTKAAASAGVATAAARQDHKHDITTATAGATAIGDSATEGSATSLARSDHKHSVSAGTPVDISTANAAGSATTFARSDHAHAGLTRGAADFNSFTAKTTPVSADIFLIEDSAASNAKKKVTLANIQSVIGAVYGAEYQYTSSEAESTTTSAAYQTKLTLSATIVGAGVYQLTWYCEIQTNSGTSDVLARILYNGATTWAETNMEPQDATSYFSFSGFNTPYLTAGSYTFDIQYRNETAGNTARIRRARLEIHRVI